MLIHSWLDYGTKKIFHQAEDELNNFHLQVSQPYSSFFSDDSLASMQKKVAEPSQLIGATDTVDNDVQPNTAATFDDQAQAEDNEDGDVDMNDAGFDED